VPDVADTLPNQFRETKIVVFRAADAQFRGGAKAVFCHWFDYKACAHTAAGGD
jgi:hypothetical protein